MKTNYIATVSYVKKDGDLTQKVKEDYIFLAENFTDVERQVNERLKDCINETFLVQGIKRETIVDFFYDNPNQENVWYKVKVRTLDEDSEKVKYINLVYYINANDTGAANQVACDELSHFSEFSVVSITETKVTERFK